MAAYGWLPGPIVADPSAVVRGTIGPARIPLRFAYGHKSTTPDNIITNCQKEGYTVDGASMLIDPNQGATSGVRERQPHPTGAR